MRILMVTSEAVPFAKTGGLADVCGALPEALTAVEHDVRMVLPRYGQIDRSSLKPVAKPLGVPTGNGEYWCQVLEARLPGGSVPVYFLEHDALFDRPGLYGIEGGEGYWDNCLRFTVLARGALQLCHQLGWYPDVIHCHDWQAALVPAFLRAFEAGSPLSMVPTILTIHNLGYQGRFGADHFSVTGLGPELFDWRTFEFHGDVNLLKGGLALTTRISTVSRSYAYEIQTAEFGEGLEKLLQYRSGHLRGILNGIDTSVWNPATDALLPYRYDSDDLSGKKRCRAELQRRAGWEPSDDRLVASFIGRLVEAKGAHLIAGAAAELVKLGVRIVILGTGTREQEAKLRALTKELPDFHAWITFDDELAHLIQAGSDLLLMPSRYEPCGLNQLYALRYGTLPVVTNVGGLRDSVVDAARDAATGFILGHPSVSSLVETVRRAVLLRERGSERFQEMVHRAMAQENGWDRAASQYVELYQEVAPR